MEKKDDGKKNILLIEDDEIVGVAVHDVLNTMGYGVLRARTGKDALDLAHDFDGDIDLAMLDMHLPDMDGPTVYPLLMAARPSLKVLVCSGYSHQDRIQDILTAGGQGFIQKPFSLCLLSKKLDETLSAS